MTEDNKNIEVQTKDLENRYLLFYVGKELYGTPLLDVREVVQYMQPKYMPNMVKYFSGVINIRGSIVGVIDVRKQFSENTDICNWTSMLVCDSKQGAIAAVVDKVDSVVTINENEIDRKPPVISKLPNEYLMGIAKVKDKLITVIHLNKVLSEDKLIQVAV